MSISLLQASQTIPTPLLDYGRSTLPKRPAKRPLPVDSSAPGHPANLMRDFRLSIWPLAQQGKGLELGAAGGRTVSAPRISLMAQLCHRPPPLPGRLL